MTDFSDMTTEELRAASEAMLAEVARREAEAEARAAVVAAVQGYAALTGKTVLAAWRALAPEDAHVPVEPDPAPIPDAPEYVPPAGAHDAYSRGDLVTFEGAVYECMIDGCVWSPIAYPQAWKKVV